MSALAIVLAPAIFAITSTPRVPGLQTTITVPNAAGDDTAALRTALQQVQSAGGNCSVEFLAGQYEFDLPGHPPSPRYGNPNPGAFQLFGVHDVVIRGTGTVPGPDGPVPATTLSFDGFDPNAAPGRPEAFPRQIFLLDDVTNVSIENVRVIMAREPYSTAIVKKKDPRLATSTDCTVSPPYWLELQLESAHPDLRDGFFIERMDDFDVAARRLMSKDFSVGFDAFATPEYHAGFLPGGRVKLSRTNTTGECDWFLRCMRSVPLERGLVLMHSKHLCNLVTSHDSTGIDLRDIDIHDMAGPALMAFDVRDITVDDVDIQPRGTHLMSLTSDAFHFQDCTGVIDVRNCEISAIGDDGLNVHTKYLRVGAAPSVTPPDALVPLTKTNAYFENGWKAGETVEFFDLRMHGVGTAVLQAFSCSDDPCSNDRFLAEFQAASLPRVQPGFLAANRDKSPDSVRVESCTVEGNIARGVLIHAPNATVTRCTFRRNTGPALVLENDAAVYFEHGNSGASTDRITFSNCVIDDANRYNSRYKGAVSVVGLYGASDLMDAGALRNVDILDNEFTGLANETTGDHAALWVTSSDAVSFAGNRFRDIRFKADDPGHHDILRLENSTNVRSSGNNHVSGFPRASWLNVSASTLAKAAPQRDSW